MDSQTIIHFISLTARMSRTKSLMTINMRMKNTKWELSLILVIDKTPTETPAEAYLTTIITSGEGNITH